MTPGNIVLVLLYEADRGRPLPVARVLNRELVIEAAKVAIAEAQMKATELRTRDAGLAVIAQAETERIRQALSTLLPELLCEVKTQVTQ